MTCLCCYGDYGHHDLLVLYAHISNSNTCSVCHVRRLGFSQLQQWCDNIHWAEVAASRTMHNKEHSASGTMHMKNILHLVLCTWRTNTHCTYSVVWKADLLLAILPFFWSPSASLMRRARGEVHVFRCQIESYDLWSFFSKSVGSWFHMHLFHCLHSTKDFPDMFLIHGQVQFCISQGL